MEKIESLQNARVKKWTSLHQKKDRDKYELFLVEGEHMIEEALHAGCVETIMTDTVCPFDFGNVVEVSEGVMQKISKNVSSVHLMAVCKKPQVKEHAFDRILILDDIQDPGNLGTLIRTAQSFSFDAVYCSEKTCDLYNEKVLRSTQGAIFHMPVIRKDLSVFINELQDMGVEVIATSLEQSETMKEITPKKKMAFILGNEGKGVHREFQKRADHRLRIEMDGFESLNVAVAGGIVMYMYQKRFG